MKLARNLLVFLLLLSPVFVDAGLVPVECSDPQKCGTCEFVSMVNNVVQFIIQMAPLVIVGMFIWAGFLLVTSRGDVAQMTTARGIFTNAFIGIVIVLASFLIVNTIIWGLSGGSGGLVSWNTVECTYPREAPENYFGLMEPVSNMGSMFGSSGAGYSGNVSVYEAGDCSPENLQSLGMTVEQSRVMSCIAGPESGCDNGADASDNGLGSSARGVFQIVYGYSDKCHSLRLPECTAANGGVPLNCGKSDDYPSSPCNNAASNFECNTAAAVCLLNGNDAGVPSGYQHWTADHRASAQQKCIDTYAN